MDNQKQKKSAGTIALVVLLLIVTIASLVLATYAWAKYTQTWNRAEDQIQVAKWNVSTTVDGATTWTKTFTHVVPQKMAPGTSGIIPVDIMLNDTDVCVKYDIFVDTLTDKPTNVKFYKAKKEGTEYVKVGDPISVPSTSTAAITGYLELKNDNTNNSTAKGTEYIMWDWPYETTGNVTVPDTSAGAAEGATKQVSGDEADTIDGQAAKTMKLQVRIVATQVDPRTVATSDNP